MTDADVQTAALADPDAQPVRKTDLKRMRRTPQIKIIRRTLGLTQEEFGVRYRIPVGTLRDWEQGRAEPDQPAKTYLSLIAHDPDCVWRMLLAHGPVASPGFMENVEKLPPQERTG